MSESATLAVATSTKERIEALATELHRPAAELVTEALEAYLDATDGYERLVAERIAQADAGSFATETEVDEFFAGHASAE